MCFPFPDLWSPLCVGQAQLHVCPMRSAVTCVVHEAPNGIRRGHKQPHTGSPDWTALHKVELMQFDRCGWTEQVQQVQNNRDNNVNTLCLQGGSMLQDASYIYQELGEKYNWTVSGATLFIVTALLRSHDSQSMTSLCFF